MWRNFLVKVVRWCNEQLNVKRNTKVFLLDLDKDMYDVVLNLVMDHMNMPNQSGEYKRDRVYKILTRKYVSISRNILSLAIEYAYREAKA